MGRHPMRVLAVAAVLVQVLALGLRPAAALPANDEIGGATPIASLPFTEAADTTGASGVASDPFDCPTQASVWYRYTAEATGRVVASTAGSGYDTVLSAYVGDGADPAALTFVDCNDDAADRTSQLQLDVEAGATYWFVVTECCGDGIEGGGALTFSLTSAPALVRPANDDLERATAITGLPHAGAVDTTGATLAATDPATCTTGGSVWFSFTPSSDVVLHAAVDGDAEVTVFRSTELGPSMVTGCNGPARFSAEAGATYLLLVDCCGDGSSTARTTTLTLEEWAPTPVPLS